MKSLFKSIIVRILEWEANILLKRHKPRIIAVSGSVGKTSTKDAIYTALTPFVTVRKSDKSFNSEFGIPLTILDLPSGWNNPLKWIEICIKGLLSALMLKEYPAFLILEIGSDRPGDIERIVSWLPVHRAVLTRLPEIPVHVEFFRDGHAVNEEDKKICKTLTTGGMIISNADDAEMKDVASRFPHTVLSYGFSQDAQIRADAAVVTYSTDTEFPVPTGMQCNVIVEGRVVPVALSGSLGIHHLYPLFAAIAVVQSLGFDIEQSVKALIEHESPKGRMKIIAGIHDSLIIDDTYNSSPIAVEEALNALAMVTTHGRKMAALGDMLELGMYTEREHIRLGVHAGKILDGLVTVGLRAEDFAYGAREAKMAKTKIHSYPDAQSTILYLKKSIKPGDIILVKGSQGMRLERVVKGLMADADRAKELLVRQEDEWEGR